MNNQQGPHFLISGVHLINIVSYIRANPSLEPTGKAMDLVAGLQQMPRVPPAFIPMIMKANEPQPLVPVPPQAKVPDEPPMTEEKKPNGSDTTPVETSG